MEEKKKGGRRKNKPAPTYKHMIRINGAEPVDLFSIPEAERKVLIQKLCDNFMFGLGYVPVDEETQKRLEEQYKESIPC